MRKTAVAFETRAQIMLVPHCACVSYNSSGYLDTCKRFALTRVPSTRISGYLAIRIRVNAAFVAGDLDESIKRNASDRLGDLVPQVRARTSPGVFRDMALLGLCLELSFSHSKMFASYFRLRMLEWPSL